MTDPVGIGLTDDGGIEIVVNKDEPDEFRIAFEPVGNGTIRMIARTPDGTEARGEIKPGAGSDVGIGQ